MIARTTLVSALGGAIFCGAIVAGCSGGNNATPSAQIHAGSNSGGSGAAAAPGAGGTSKTAPVSITVAIPAKSTATTRRSKQYVSPNTASVQVLANNSYVGTIACTTTTCSGSVLVPLTTTSLTVQLLDVNDVVLSQSTETVTIVAGTANTFTFLFDAVLITLKVVAPTLSQLVISVPTTFPVIIEPLDATGAAIVAPGNLIDENGNILISANGATQTVLLTPSSPALTLVSPITWNPANYTLGVTVHYDGTDPNPGVTPKPIVLNPSTTIDGTIAPGFGGIGMPLNIPVVAKGIQVVASAGPTPTAYQVTSLSPYVVQPTPNITIANTIVEFFTYPSPAPVTVNLSVISNYPGGGNAVLSANTCGAYDPGGNIAAAFANAVAYNATPHAFTVNISGPPVGPTPPPNQSCSFTLTDSANNLQAITTFSLDDFTLSVNGKARK